jgi:hypothetical protein
VFIGYLRVGVELLRGFTDPDPVDVEVIPGPEKSREPGINGAVAES